MIEFTCLCGCHLSVPEDLAGGLFQCPKCKRLNDVPLLGDLANIDQDGIFKLDEPPRIKDDPDRIAKLTTVFTRDRFDADGNPIDNRQTLEELAEVDRDIVPLANDKAAPRYDPLTGELIREVDVKPLPGAEGIPMARRAPQAAPRVVDHLDVPDALELVAIPFRLLKPVNLLVMSFILLAQMLAQGMIGAIATFYLVLAPFWLLLQALILSHFGNVIDETGPVSRQELPTPLRGVTREDTVSPLSAILTAMAICYGPSLVLMFTGRNLPPEMVLLLVLGLAIAGTVMLPAALLITSTSGSYVNLRPDRLLKTALVCGAEYLVLVVICAAALVFYIGGVVLVSWVAAAYLDRNFPDPPWLRWYLAYAVLMLGIYSVHLFCWYLGTMYRKHHGQFPWAYQRHRSEKAIAPPTGFPIGRPVPPARREKGGKSVSRV